MNNLEQQNIAITKLLSTLLGENYSQYSRENLYSLEEASTIAYIEIFGNDNKVDYEEEIYNNPNDRRTQLSIRKKLPDGTDKGYSNFKKKYKKCIDKFLKNVLGDKYGLDMFRILNEGNKIMYSISKDDIIFFNRVFFAYYPEGADDFDSIDYKNLSKKSSMQSVLIE